MICARKYTHNLYSFARVRGIYTHSGKLSARGFMEFELRPKARPARGTAHPARRQSSLSSIARVFPGVSVYLGLVSPFLRLGQHGRRLFCAYLWISFGPVCLSFFFGEGSGFCGFLGRFIRDWRANSFFGGLFVRVVDFSLV